MGLQGEDSPKQTAIPSGHTLTPGPRVHRRSPVRTHQEGSRLPAKERGSRQQATRQLHLELPVFRTEEMSV